MRIPWHLFRAAGKPARCAIVVGDGQFNVHVASTAKQRIELERLCGRGTEGRHGFPVRLIPQPTSVRGGETVVVRIGDATVGYLHHTTALEFLAALRTGAFDRAACGAIVVAMADPQLGDQAFRIRLDAEVPLKLADPEIKAASTQKENEAGHSSSRSPARSADEFKDKGMSKERRNILIGVALSFAAALIGVAAALMLRASAV
jgi:hypothetical protein